MLGLDTRENFLTNLHTNGEKVLSAIKDFCDTLDGESAREMQALCLPDAGLAKTRAGPHKMFYLLCI